MRTHPYRTVALTVTTLALLAPATAAHATNDTRTVTWVMPGSTGQIVWPQYLAGATDQRGWCQEDRYRYQSREHRSIVDALLAVGVLNGPHEDSQVYLSHRFIAPGVGNCPAVTAPTPEPTWTPTPDPTPTTSPTATPSPTSSATPSPSPEPSGTPTPQPSPASTNEPSPTSPEPSPTPTSDPAPSTSPTAPAVVTNPTAPAAPSPAAAPAPDQPATSAPTELAATGIDPWWGAAIAAAAIGVGSQLVWTVRDARRRRGENR